MDFTLDNFTDRLRKMMYDSFPFEPDIINELKHSNRTEHIRDVAFWNNGKFKISDNEIVFEIGNEFAEEFYPYYHILEDAPYIRKRNRATDKTKGSQALVENLGQRDYGIVSFNGKTYSKEYSRNVRGKRSRLSSVSQWATDSRGNKIRINRESDSYLNTHYQYIEKMLNFPILDNLAFEFGLTRARTQLTSLEEDYNAANIVDIINSMTEE